MHNFRLTALKIASILRNEKLVNFLKEVGPDYAKDELSGVAIGSESIYEYLKKQLGLDFFDKFDEVLSTSKNKGNQNFCSINFGLYIIYNSTM